MYFWGGTLVPDKNCAIHIHLAHPTRDSAAIKHQNIHNFQGKAADPALPSPSEDFGGSLGLLSNEILEKKGGNLKPFGKGGKNSPRSESPRPAMSKWRLFLGREGSSASHVPQRPFWDLSWWFQDSLSSQGGGTGWFVQVFPAPRCPKPTPREERSA